ncbi:hypothetical protein Pfo_002481 [Paulownia fortunei]|nr:hypothetical protein Pfo_002481 [Paulownia fortunei]
MKNLHTIALQCSPTSSFHPKAQRILKEVGNLTPPSFRFFLKFKAADRCGLFPVLLIGELIIVNCLMASTADLEIVILRMRI